MWNRESRFKLVRNVVIFNQRWPLSENAFIRRVKAYLVSGLVRNTKHEYDTGHSYGSLGARMTKTAHVRQESLPVSTPVSQTLQGTPPLPQCHLLYLSPIERRRDRRYTSPLLRRYHLARLINAPTPQFQRIYPRPP